MIPRSSLPYVLARLRCPTHLLECPHWASLPVPEVASAAKEMPIQRRGAGFRRLSGGWIFASSGDWDSGSVAFTVSHESRDALLRTPGHSRRFPGMLLSLNTLSAEVSHPTQEPSSEFFPTASGIRQSASRRNFAISRGSPGAPLSTAWTRPPVSWHAIFPVHPFGPRVSHQIPRHLLSSLPATRAIQRCASWRSYNTHRPHRSLQLRPPHPESPIPVDGPRQGPTSTKSSAA